MLRSLNKNEQGEAFPFLTGLLRDQKIEAKDYQRLVGSCAQNKKPAQQEEALANIIAQGQLKPLLNCLEEGYDLEIALILEAGQTEKLIKILKAGQSGELIKILEDEETRELIQIFVAKQTGELIKILEAGETHQLIKILQSPKLYEHLHSYKNKEEFRAKLLKNLKLPRKKRFWI